MTRTTCSVDSEKCQGEKNSSKGRGHRVLERVGLEVSGVEGQGGPPGAGNF